MAERNAGKTIIIVRPTSERANMALEGWIKLHDSKDNVPRVISRKAMQAELEDGTRIIALSASAALRGGDRGYSNVEYV